MAEFEIKVSELDAGGKDFVFPIRASWLSDQLEALGDAREGLRAPDFDGELTCFAEQAGTDVILQGRIVGGLLAECSRCLGPAPIAVDAAIAMLLSARGKGIRPAPGEEDLSPDEIDREFYTGDLIVLDDAVREQLLLEVPMQPLCRQDCEGIPVPESVKGPADLMAEVEAAPGSLAAELAKAGLAKSASSGQEAPAVQPNGKQKTKRAR